MSKQVGPLRLAVENWIADFNFTKRIQGGFTATFLKMYLYTINLATPFLKQVRDIPGIPREYRKLIDDVTGTEPITLGLVAITVLMGLFAGIISGIVAPISRVISQWVDAGVESARADPGVAFPMMWRTPEHKDELIKHVKQLGWNETIIDGFETLLRPQIQPAELLTLWKREDITSIELDNALRAFGWQDEAIGQLKTLKDLIPGPGDLISMAVREAFTPDVVAQFGYGEDFPQEFAYWAEKQGLSEAWARRYWSAHWKLPSTQAGYEMLHRGVIDQNTLELLLKTADIPAFWRDKLMAISYATYTRVDIRRMYQIGVLSSSDEVVTAYMDIGYDLEKALKLTEFTLREYGEETREASKGDVLTAYELGRLTHDEAVNLLGAIDYPLWIAEAYLSRIDLQRANKLASDLIQSVKTLYTGGQTSRTDVVSQLSTIPIPSVEIDRYLEEWDITRQAKTKRPSRADLRKMFLSNIIEEDTYRFELSGHGLAPDYVKWFIDQAKIDLAELARKENETAMKEAERLLTAEFKTDLDVELAGYDVLISQAGVAIADTKLAMVEGMTIPEIDEAKRVILEYKTYIANFRRDKSELRKAYLLEKQQGE